MVPLKGRQTAGSEFQLNGFLNCPGTPRKRPRTATLLQHRLMKSLDFSPSHLLQCSQYPPCLLPPAHPESLFLPHLLTLLGRGKEIRGQKKTTLKN